MGAVSISLNGGTNELRVEQVSDFIVRSAPSKGKADAASSAITPSTELLLKVSGSRSQASTISFR